MTWQAFAFRAVVSNRKQATRFITLPLEIEQFVDHAATNTGRLNIKSHSKYQITLPHASALVESLRAFGYSLETAVADLIDNSIAANANSVRVTFKWEGRNSSVSITDNGHGMSPEELTEAMRPGTTGPLASRSPKDLGRFGLGLKTASFSQCRRMTVVSKCKESQFALRCWDLDYIAETGEWRLITADNVDRSDSFVNESSISNKGTIVIWEKLDRIAGDVDPDDEAAYRRFLAGVDSTRTHLGMVFHDFIENRRLKIWINEREVDAWDGFLKNESATRALPPENLVLNTQTITITPFVLPHHSKLPPEVHKRAAGPRGWNAHQGFYVYRNNRLLVSGDWLGLGFQKEEHYKLARIQVNLPNTLDDEWEIDVKKSRAKPPGVLRSDLTRIARLSRSKAVQVYRHRGKVTARKNAQEDVFVWTQKRRAGRIAFAINRDHPSIQPLFDSVSDNQLVEVTLRIIEETLPSAHITIVASEHGNNIASPFEELTLEEFKSMISPLYKSFVSHGYTTRESFERVASIEPFSLLPEFLQLYKESIGVDHDET